MLLSREPIFASIRITILELRFWINRFSKSQLEFRKYPIEDQKRFSSRKIAKLDQIQKNYYIPTLLTFKPISRIFFYRKPHEINVILNNFSLQGVPFPLAAFY